MKLERLTDTKLVQTWAIAVHVMRKYGTKRSEYRLFKIIKELDSRSIIDA